MVKANLLLEISENRQNIAMNMFQLPTFPKKLWLDGPIRQKLLIKRPSEVDKLCMVDNDQHGSS